MITIVRRILVDLGIIVVEGLIYNWVKKNIFKKINGEQT